MAITGNTLFQGVPVGKMKPAFTAFAALAFPIPRALDAAYNIFFVVKNALVAEAGTATLWTRAFLNRIQKAFAKLTLGARSAIGA